MRRPHVDEFLDELDPVEFAEWHAYYFVEPWGDEWRQVGRLGSVLHNDMLHLRAANGEEIEEDDWHHEEDYIPRLADEEDERPDEPTPDEIMELMREWYGANR